MVVCLFTKQLVSAIRPPGGVCFTRVPRLATAVASVGAVAVAGDDLDAAAADVLVQFRPALALPVAAFYASSTIPTQY